jgi:hypothetical protein
MKTTFLGLVIYLLPCAVLGQASPDIIWSRLGSTDPPTKGFAICAAQDLVAMGSGSSITIRRLSSGNLVRRFPGFIESMDFSPDGHFLVGTGDDGVYNHRLAMYDVNGGVQVWSTGIIGLEPAVFSHNGKWIIGPSGHASPELRKYGLDGQILHTYAGIGRAAISSDDSLIAGRTHVGDIQIVHSDTGTIVRTINTSVVFALAFSPNGHEIAGGTGSSVTIWDIADGSVVVNMGDLGQDIDWIRYSRDGRIIYASGTNGAFFDDGRVVGEVPGNFGAKFVGDTYECLLNTQGRELVRYRSDGSCLGTFPAIAGPLLCASKSADRFVEVDGDFQPYYYLSNLINPEITDTCGMTRTEVASFFDNGQQLASVRRFGDPDGEDDSTVLLFDAATGNQNGDRAVAGEVSSISPAGVAASVSSFYDAKGTNETTWGVVLTNLSDGTISNFPGETFNGSGLRAWAQISDQETYLAISVKLPYSYTEVVDVASHDVMFRLPSAATHAVFSPDNDLVAVDGDLGIVDRVRRISQNGVALYTVGGRALAFSPNGEHLATSSAGAINFLNAETGASVKVLGQAAGVSSLKWMSGVIIYAGTENGVPYQRAIFDPFTVKYGAPSGFNLVRGNVISGGVPELVNSDDDSLNLGLGRTVTPLQAPIEVEIDGTTSANSASVLQFKIESSASRSQIRQSIELFDYTTGGWVSVDSRIIGTSDGVVDVNLGENTSRFLQNGHLRGRVSYRKDGTISPSPWTVKIDQVKWTMAP